MASAPTLAPPDASALLLLPSFDGLPSLSDDELRARQQQFAVARRRVDVGSARVAAELARRSAREFGYAGLAQKDGLRSAERLVEKLAGVTPGEARAMVRVGELLESAPGGLAAVATAVESGDLSLMAADAIRSGLGEPTDSVSIDEIADAAELMVDVAKQLPVARVGAQARALRDSLDEAGVAEREELLRSRRYLRLSPQADGTTRVSGLLDPESAAIVTSAFDHVTSPRRGGPRFVDPTEVERARRIVDDPRTNEQLLADAFVEMVRIAGEADPGTVFAQRRPAVTIHVELSDLETGVGAAHLEGQTSAVSIDTAKRHACASGAVPILFDGPDVLNLGRTQRLFTERQRIALAARDGGCRFDGCDRPPSWCEAHHIDEFQNGGLTNVDVGILLCRFHHMFVHNAGWKIRKTSSGFRTEPPPDHGGEAFDMPAHYPRPRR